MILQTFNINIDLLCGSKTVWTLINWLFWAALFTKKGIEINILLNKEINIYIYMCIKVSKGA